MAGGRARPRGARARAGAEPALVRFGAKQGGSYRILARVADARGRENETELRVWVAGGRLPHAARRRAGAVTLVPDRKEYRRATSRGSWCSPPFAPAEGVLTLRRAGPRCARSASGSTSAIRDARVPIEDAFTPNVHVQVDLVGAAPRDDARRRSRRAARARPAFASGRLDLAVPPRARTLALAVTPREPPLDPGGETLLELRRARRRGPAGRERRGGGRGGGRGGARAHRLPTARPARRLLLARASAGVSDHRLRAHVLLAAPPEAPRRRGHDRSKAGTCAVHASAARRCPPPRRWRGWRRRRGCGEAGRADQCAHRLLGARALRRERAARRRGPRERPGEAARQPDPLPRDGRGGLPAQRQLRLGRGDAHRAPAADGAPLARRAS